MYALVDVETTGLSRDSDRIVQIAVRQLNGDGTHLGWSTLVDPERDPGPTHLHGITEAHLRGAPRFGDIAGQVAGLLAGRIVVAHNASFDWQFISQECARTAVPPEAEFRLCTLAMARRLDLPLPDLKLGTLAAWAGVQQTRWHDARDDVNTLHGIFHRLWAVTADSGLPVPYTRNGALEAAPSVARAPKIDSPWAVPGAWTIGTPLTQGTRFCITGGTSIARTELYGRALRGELVPMNAVSTRTSLLVANSPHLESVKLRRARELGLPVIDENHFISLLSNILPGRPKGATRPAEQRRSADGPLAGRRVLVVGGDHAAQAEVRAIVAAAGGRCAVNLTPTVNTVTLLPGWEADGRADRLHLLDRLDPTNLVTVSPDEKLSRRGEPTSGPRPVESADENTSLARGQVVDLPADTSIWHLFVTWPLLEPPLEVDVLAMLVDEAGQVVSDDHLAFFNSPDTPGGSIRVDVATDGEADVALDLDELTAPGHRVVVAACLSGGQTFGDLGPVEFVVRDSEGRPAARSVLDAATVEKAMILAEIYQRGDQGRIRAIGQGYDDSLHDFVTRYGVVVD